MNTNKHNPGGHERKIVTKLQNMEKNNRVVAPVGGKGVSLGHLVTRLLTRSI